MTQQMALVISLEGNRSTAGERIVMAWVFEGSIATGSVANHAAILNIADYGIDLLTEESLYSTQLVKHFPIQIKILRIVKYKEWYSMEAGYSGALYLEDEANAKEVAELLDISEYIWIPPVKRSSLKSPCISKRILLFDSELTAQNYLQSEHSIEL
ncbi:hypothetical protein [Deinococcus sp.]|uniref:hypothetical protein n=1 Tax=Deinococcus sp. TaxID=47478 RepID=UPI00286DB471|nr:hypothetical protein [Deinococcus sp.]